jgi:hypothetical protein
LVVKVLRLIRVLIVGTVVKAVIKTIRVGFVFKAGFLSLMIMKLL